MKGKRQWVGRRVWVADEDGTKHKGSLWFANESDVLIREDHRLGLVTFSKAAEGVRWGFADDAARSDPGTA